MFLPTWRAIYHARLGEQWGAVVMKYHGDFASEQVLMPKVSCRRWLYFQILQGKDGVMRISLSLSSQMVRRERNRGETVELLIQWQNYGFHNFIICSHSSLTFGDTFNKINNIQNHWKGFQGYRISKVFEPSSLFHKALYFTRKHQGET